MKVNLSKNSPLFIPRCWWCGSPVVHSFLRSHTWHNFATQRNAHFFDLAKRTLLQHHKTQTIRESTKCTLPRPHETHNTATTKHTIVTPRNARYHDPTKRTLSRPHETHIIATPQNVFTTLRNTHVCWKHEIPGFLNLKQK